MSKPNPNPSHDLNPKTNLKVNTGQNIREIVRAHTYTQTRTHTGCNYPATVLCWGGGVLIVVCRGGGNCRRV